MCILDFINQSCRCVLKIPLIHSVLCPWLFPLFLFTDTFLPRDCFFWTSILSFPTHIWWGLLVLTHVHEKQLHFCASPAVGEGCVISSSQWAVRERCVSRMGQGREKLVCNSLDFLSSHYQLGGCKFVMMKSPLASTLSYHLRTISLESSWPHSGLCVIKT